MALQTVKINSILNGRSALTHFSSEGQFIDSSGIDPEMNYSMSGGQASGFITPVVYDKFSGSNISGAPNWILTSNKDNSMIYAYMRDGKFVSYLTSLTVASETLVGTPTSGAGNGAVYYNNYYYLATPTDVSRYGPLNGTPALTNTVWTGATLGSQTALTNTTYPFSYPNHVMHVHVDGALYFCDYLNGQGMIHKIKTSKTTVEGDTNDGSAYNVLDLPFGYLPTDIDSYGTDLVISAIRTTDSFLYQGSSALFFWDTFSDSFYKQIDIQDPLCSAIKNKNGTLIVFSGSSEKLAISTYQGGNSLNNIYYDQTGFPPPTGAVEVVNNRILWGGKSNIGGKACVYAMGYSNPTLPQFAVNNIIQTSGTAGQTSAIKYYRHNQEVNQFVVGWSSANSYGLDKLSASATKDNTIRLPMINVGQPFEVKSIKMHITDALSAATSIVATMYFDDENLAVPCYTINDDNYKTGVKNIIITRNKMNGNPLGDYNFFLELKIGGTDKISIAFPITIEIETKEMVYA